MVYLYEDKCLISNHIRAYTKIIDFVIRNKVSDGSIIDI